eukprot:8914731-Alexandrium_andersonii.AAC.1
MQHLQRGPIQTHLLELGVRPCIVLVTRHGARCCTPATQVRTLIGPRPERLPHKCHYDRGSFGMPF